MGCTVDELQAIFIFTIAYKGQAYLPLGARIKKTQFIPGNNRLQADQLHRCGVKECIWFAAMIGILKAIRFQCDVLIHACLQR